MMLMKIPNFFIVGAPKCGTTAMNDYLNQHPDVFMAHKELHYFGEDLQIKNRISEPEYLQHFQNAVGEKIVGEASVWYLFSATAAKEIKHFSPDAKVLIMLRNPVEMIYSLHSQNLYDGNEDVPDFETALSLDEKRKKGIKLPQSIDFFQIPSYIDSALFSEQVKRYIDVFGKENLHIVLYEDFVENTVQVVLNVFRFLNVDTNVRVDYGLINPNKKIRSFYLHKSLKHPPSTLKKAVRIIMPIRKTRHMIMRLLFEWNVQIRKRKKMDVSVQNKLRSFFAKDIQRLSELINMDLTGWLRSK